MDFNFTPKVKELQARVGAFMDEHVYPNEQRFPAEIEANRRNGNAWIPTRVVEELKVEARKGLFNGFFKRLFTNRLCMEPSCEACK